jgi:hypothetical protein
MQIADSRNESPPAAANAAALSPIRAGDAGRHERRKRKTFPSEFVY